MAGQPPTRRQLEVLRTYIAAGSVAAAAYELGISETTVRQHLSGLYRRIGCLNAAQAAYRLGKAIGAGTRTSHPDGLRPKEDVEPPVVTPPRCRASATAEPQPDDPDRRPANPSLDLVPSD